MLYQASTRWKVLSIVTPGVGLIQNPARRTGPRVSTHSLVEFYLGTARSSLVRPVRIGTGARRRPPDQLSNKEPAIRRRRSGIDRARGRSLQSRNQRVTTFGSASTSAAIMGGRSSPGTKPAPGIIPSPLSLGDDKTGQPSSNLVSAV